ncbi:Hypothetical protein, putative [Bodo saltans]|uniref:Membrane-associated protein n=1 Tax=Bodo saltans TaxID=75058 RepID=A0A0S4JCU9_BODSA|nr:Hypothetical protein, putative [Bodo saltans]|eukprot:CUG89221.1 Hypothetical protein, putative [Bodo saltans]
MLCKRPRNRLLATATGTMLLALIAALCMVASQSKEEVEEVNDIRTAGGAPPSSSTDTMRAPPVHARLGAPHLSISEALQTAQLASSWGYATERNAARWKLIRASFAARLPTVWRTGYNINISTPQQQQHHRTLRVMDLGADQGYFTVSMMRLLQTVLTSMHHNDNGRRDDKGIASDSTTRLRPQQSTVVGFAVEKGGFGGAFWRQKEFAAASRSVHDEIREHFIAEKATQTQNNTGVTVEEQLWICPTTITLPFLQSSLLQCTQEPSSLSLSSSCKVSVILALSMLHWVEGVDGVDGFRATICTLASAADSLIVELPHPSAKKTFGEKRYRGWYSRNPNRNVTALLEETAAMCPDILAALLVKKKKSGAPSYAGGVVTQSSCTFRLELVGRTPWGRSLFREIHRIDQECRQDGTSRHDAVSSPSVTHVALPPSEEGDACITHFGCFEVR